MFGDGASIDLDGRGVANGLSHSGLHVDEGEGECEFGSRFEGLFVILVVAFVMTVVTVVIVCDPVRDGVCC
jgi:hypothetical protein